MDTCPYWLPRDYEEIAKANRFVDLAPVALRVIDRMADDFGSGLSQVCGPITSGGHGMEVNRKIFKAAVRELRIHRVPVFDQNPLELQMQRLWGIWKQDYANRNYDGSPKYCWSILYDVYLPILSSGKVTRLFFLPGWESSAGTCWERAQALAQQITVEEYPHHHYENILWHIELPV